MRVTFRAKLMGIAGVAAFAFLLLIVASALIARGVESRLLSIRESYLPRVELKPELESQFERIQRSFQDSVASRDKDAVAETAELKKVFLEQLATAGTAIAPANAAEVRRALEDYYQAAREVSLRLIAGETGEALTVAIGAMQSKQTLFSAVLTKTTTFDRRELAEAFSAAMRAESEATLYRFWISLACVAAALFLSAALSRAVLRSLGDLTAGFERFGHGDLGTRIEVRSRDELGDLAERANQMAENLERLVKERTMAEAALKLANRELEAFSYSVAHDLRSPLRGMNGFAQILLDAYGDKLDDEGKDYLQEILTNAKKMAALIDALLSLSRTTRADLKREWTDLAAIARSIVSQLTRTDPRPTVEVVIAEGLRADVDPPLARALIENLLANAWKFTSKVDSPRIEFGKEYTADGSAFFIRDNGAGFDMAYASKLFSPFQRLHATAEFPGTGVGLATVQRIVQRHGGRVWAEGTVGKGAAFYFTLPMRETGGPQP